MGACLVSPTVVIIGDDQVCGCVWLSGAELRGSRNDATPCCLYSSCLDGFVVVRSFSA